MLLFSSPVFSFTARRPFHIARWPYILRFSPSLLLGAPFVVTARPLRIPLQRLFYLIGGEFKVFFSADRSGQFWAVQEWFSFGSYGLFRPFCGPGQWFWNGFEEPIWGLFGSQKSQNTHFRPVGPKNRPSRWLFHSQKHCPGLQKGLKSAYEP